MIILICVSLVVFVVVLLFFIFVFVEGSKFDEVLVCGYLIVGIGSINVFWYFKSVDDKLQGFDVDMGYIIVKVLFGDFEKVEYVNQFLDVCILNIIIDKVDIICQFMIVIGECVQQVNFIIFYYCEGVGLMLKVDG